MQSFNEDIRLIEKERSRERNMVWMLDSTESKFKKKEIFIVVGHVGEICDRKGHI